MRSERPGRGAGWTVVGLFAVLLFVALIAAVMVFGMIYGVRLFGS